MEQCCVSLWLQYCSTTPDSSILVLFPSSPSVSVSVSVTLTIYSVPHQVCRWAAGASPPHCLLLLHLCSVQTSLSSSSLTQVQTFCSTCRRSKNPESQKSQCVTWCFTLFFFLFFFSFSLSSSAPCLLDLIPVLPRKPGKVTSDCELSLDEWNLLLTPRSPFFAQTNPNHCHSNDVLVTCEAGFTVSDSELVICLPVESDKLPNVQQATVTWLKRWLVVRVI